MALFQAVRELACPLPNDPDPPPASYTVEYEGNGATGGSVPVDGNKYPTGEEVTVSGNSGNLEKTGHTFLGWNTQADGNGIAYLPGQTFIMGSTDVILYAEWTTLPTYTVTYDDNGATGGSVPTDSNNYLQGQLVTVSGNSGSLVRIGYAFAGWNTQADGGGVAYTQGQTFIMGSSNVTLYAKWDALARPLAATEPFG